MPKIGLVDPIRTSRALVHELRRRGVEHVVVESGLVGALPDDLGPVVRVDGPAHAMAAQLRKLGVTQVVGCVDPSILYADQLCALLGVPFSGLRSSEARRNKAKMNDAIRAAGLRAPWQFE